ncbi:MAG: hypothetical protein NVV82_12095 [Sporocytophaga sp.]|nr:hypothetical protein [Sporocytophaga sp.]
MGWTIIRFNGQGKKDARLSQEFEIKGFDHLNLKNFRVIKFLDPYGDYSIGAKQFDDLTKDLKELEEVKKVEPKLLKELVQLIDQCKNDPNSYLKIFGD